MEKHINEIASKGRQRLGCLQRYRRKLDRRSLEQCYITFVRPILEYGNVIFDAANNEDLEILDNIEKESLRVITGARRRCNLDALYQEVSWPSLSVRRENQKLATLGKIIINKFPSYLIDDLPTFYSESRNVRKNTFAIPRSNHDYYDRSFVPSSINLWNSQPHKIRCIGSAKSLKSQLKSKVQKNIPKYYYYGPRNLNILHTKLRIGCSDLNADKFLIGVSDTDLCEHCGGGEVENANHFFLECGHNLVAKVEMHDKITDILSDKGLIHLLDIDLLLYGSDQLSLDENKQVFNHVQRFIKESNRFVI